MNASPPQSSPLEKIRFSITRLKQDTFFYLDPPYLPWKDKILDYEIETKWIHVHNVLEINLEKIRFSITRLKHCEMAFECVARCGELEKIRFSITRLKHALSLAVDTYIDYLKR